MSKIEIVKAGLMTSIQDLGRKGFSFYGIPNSGVMDEDSAKIALLLLRKREDEPLIECTSVAPEIKFHDASQIAVTGADFSWSLNEEKISLNTVISVRSGDMLVGKFAKNGLRGYIAIKGSLKMDPVMSSFSTYVNASLGGFKGRLLKKGDIIEWSDDSLEKNIIQICKGPEFGWLSDEAKDVLVSEEYVVSRDTNRMGMRLEGKVLACDSYQLAESSPVLPGFIQLPPSGLPIVVLQDGQTTGGYPRIAYVKEEMLSALNQVPIGGKVRFLI